MPHNQTLLRATGLALVAGLTLAASHAALAQASFPNKPIRLLVGFAPGGPSDIISRVVGAKIGEILGTQFVIENKTGAGGNLAFTGVASAKPDGYTLLFSTPGIAINPSLYRKAGFKSEDFTPIALVGEAPLVLLANPTRPYKSVPELVVESKKRPDEIRFASSGNGSSSHLAMDVLRAMTAMQYLHVPYRGGGPAMTDTMSGQTDVTMLPIAESMPYVRDGRLRSLGQTGAKRSSIAPDMPTIGESVPGYSSTTWYMLLGPAGTPPEVVAWLQQQVARALAAPDLKEKLKDAGVDIINGNAAEAAAFLQSEQKKWAERIKASGTVIE
jgi:tripartite-type tricarboxylate transporter receptor subunit TctC